MKWMGGKFNSRWFLVQKHTGIPIPKILDWNDDATNKIGSEYIIMECAPGIPLQQQWTRMSGDQKVRCIDAIYSKLREMVDIEFPAYGSLYFSGALPDTFPRVPLNDEYCIGPHCGSRYWNLQESGGYQQCANSRGPCQSCFRHWSTTYKLMIIFRDDTSRVLRRSYGCWLCENPEQYQRFR